MKREKSKNKMADLPVRPWMKTVKVWPYR